MFKDLDNRTQLALALMATEKVYENWMEKSDGRSSLTFSVDKYRFDILPQDLTFYVW